MKFLINAVNARVQLQHKFNDEEIEKLLEDITNAPSGYPVLFAYKYGGVLYIQNLFDVVLNTIDMRKDLDEHIANYVPMMEV